jgi:3-deoxy-D-manno-octulosonic-acid transferase
VGKSLNKALEFDSGQNPIEAAMLGCKIFHGPNVINFAGIYKFLKKLGVTKEISNANELSLSIIEEFNEDRAKNDEISAKLESYGQNIFNNVTMELKKYI